MRIWQRAERDRFCGYCARAIPRGAPTQKIALYGMTRSLYRGECCAGNAPPDLPALIEREPPQLRAAREQPFRPIQQIPITRTRGRLRDMAKQYLPHPND